MTDNWFFNVCHIMGIDENLKSSHGGKLWEEENGAHMIIWKWWQWVSNGISHDGVETFF